MEEDFLNCSIYEKELLQKVKDIEFGLKYYIQRCHSLEREKEYFKSAYENRVDKFLNALNNLKKED